MLKLKIVFYFLGLILFAAGFTADGASGQTVAYRETNLAASVPDAGNNLTPGLLNPWGIGFLSGQAFFIADNGGGHVTALDASGVGVRPGSFLLPNAAGTGFEHPTGMVADQNSSFGSASVIKPFLVVTDEGSIFSWGPNAQGDFPSAATAVRRTAGAVYTGAALLNSAQTAPVLAVADFHGGFIESFLPGFSRVALPGSFTDPTLPAGFAPFGMQVIGAQVFVTYAVQDAAKHDPVAGAGNGVVSIFDMNGNFVKRFATAGALNAPWGIAKASSSFGPFSNDILIGNVGDGKINAFDPNTGQFVGTLADGNGTAIVETGLHALAFRGDGFGDANTLYFTSEITNSNDGLFGAISSGLVSTVRVSASSVSADGEVSLTADVAAGPGNAGSPSGLVSFFDGATLLKSLSLANGTATLDTFLAGTGVHPISAQYSGDRVFLPRSEETDVQVAGIATSLTLIAPAEATTGATIVLTVAIRSAGGVPTGQVSFLDGKNNLGVTNLNDAGAAVLRVDTLAAGTHSLTASYAGDDKFAASSSTAVTVNVTNPDFAFAATPASASVVAGNSTQFVLTVTPSGGFSNNVTFSCAAVTGITCSFNPATVTPGRGAANTTLNVATSATVSRYGLVMPRDFGPWIFLFAVALAAVVVWRARNLPSARLAPGVVSAAAILTLCLVLGGCTGYSNRAQPNKGTATIMVTAQSGTVSHSTTVSVTVE
jgi:uncharacterized protein (TIGR03118 family)